MNEKLLAVTQTNNENGLTYPGYPTTLLKASDIGSDASGALVLPDGPWAKNNDTLPNVSESAAFRAAGYETDSVGRPLHPWLNQLLDGGAGLVTGKGFYYNWGPNYTADPIVLTKEARTSVLLIQRGDTGIWALPGGFIDEGETNPADAARRELFEETNLKIELAGDLIYQDVVADLRTTANAWAETAAYSFVVNSRLPVAVTDPNEVKSVAWFYADSLPKELHGSHAVLIDMAIERLKDPPRSSIRDILSTPNEQLEITVIDAGHMAYDHLFVRSDKDLLFVKAHDASRFSDPFREAHSRAYLEKEFDVYTQLALAAYLAIPNRVDLIDDSILAMDALPEDEGWQWRAPKESQFDDYVKDILKAFDQLQMLPFPEKPRYHNAIEPTYETFWKEGWDDIDDQKIMTITTRIKQLSAGWNVEQKEYVRKLIDALPALRQNARNIPRDVPLFMAHNDARQSNIGRKAGQGAKLVDWSWADPAPRNTDSTLFLIDLVKSGHDVTPYLSYINTDILILQIGFLCGHSLWNTRDGSTTVREQQIASASAAYQILTLLTDNR